MANDRTAQLKNTALQLGMKYSPEDEWGLLNLLKDFQLFRRGHHRKATHLLSRQIGMLETEANIFDYHYTISSSNSSRTFKQTVFFVHSKKLGLPQFLLKPENFFHKIGQLLGMQDIDFEAFPEFSDQYLLRGEDEDYIRSSFPPAALQFFTVEKNWSLEGLNYYLVLYQKNRLLTPAQIIDFYKKGMYLHDVLASDGP
ncbi:MAG: hypothetical protein KDC66_01260 [Phaeodactylibacter sp.]|nr:hypothetical protein [Phaeodactylibacter sp.]MCB9273917.1 hypothetical protein [Lewinellaceae bacterium]